MQVKHEQYAVQLIGRFGISAPDGTSITPRGKRARAILAMLVIAPGGSRSRVWLQDRLWSGRDSGHGGASLRQALSEIRRSFGHHRDILQADGDTVTIRVARCRVDLFDLMDNRIPEHLLLCDTPTLLEDVDIRDPEFEDWIREKRQHWNEQIASRLHDAQAVSFGREEAASSEVSIRPNRTGFHLGLLNPTVKFAGPITAVVADAVLDLVADSMVDLGLMDVFDFRYGDLGAGYDRTASNASPDLLLKCRARDVTGGTDVCLYVMSGTDRNILSSVHTVVTPRGGSPNQAPEVLDLVGRTTDSLVYHLWQEIEKQELHSESPRKLSLGAMFTIFRLGKKDLISADRQLERAFSLEPKGETLAWRAFIRSILLLERKSAHGDDLAEEAHSFIRRAMELSPNSGLTLGFASHVNGLILHDPSAAFALADRAVQRNATSPLLRAFLANAHSMLGDHETAFQQSRVALKLACNSPFQYYFDALCCITAAMSNRYELALRHAQAARAMAPDFAPPLRYGAAACVRLGRRAEALNALGALSANEDNFTPESLCDPAYPMRPQMREVLVSSGVLNRLQ